MEKQNKSNPAIAALVVIVLIGLTTVIAYKNDSKIAATAPAATSDQTSQSTANNTYKDGEYNGKGNYLTPGGRESIGVSIKLKNNIIMSAKLSQQATNGDTAVYQRKFASGYKSQVVGKSIDEVKLSRVAGSSLTSNGFNDALEQIKTNAAS